MRYTGCPKQAREHLNWQIGAFTDKNNTTVQPSFFLRSHRSPSAFFCLFGRHCIYKNIFLLFNDCVRFVPEFEFQNVLVDVKNAILIIHTHHIHNIICLYTGRRAKANKILKTVNVVTSQNFFALLYSFFFQQKTTVLLIIIGDVKLFNPSANERFYVCTIFCMLGILFVR